MTTRAPSGNPPIAFKGTLLYRVVEVDDVPAPSAQKHQGGYTWQVLGIPLAYYSHRQLRLSKAFPGLAGTHYTPSTSIGRLFFLTEGEALDDFIRRRQVDFDHANRALVITARAITWADQVKRALSSKEGA